MVDRVAPDATETMLVTMMLPRPRNDGPPPRLTHATPSGSVGLLLISLRTTTD